MKKIDKETRLAIREMFYIHNTPKEDILRLLKIEEEVFNQAFDENDLKMVEIKKVIDKQFEKEEVIREYEYGNGKKQIVKAMVLKNNKRRKD